MAPNPVQQRTVPPRRSAPPRDSPLSFVARLHKHMRAVIVLAVIAISGLAGCGDVCDNEPSSSIVSPSGNLKVVVFNRGCGATTGFNTQLSIVQANEALPKEAGNTFIADGTVPLKIQWQSDAKLLISGVQGQKVFKQEARVRGITVTYE